VYSNGAIHVFLKNSGYVQYLQARAQIERLARSMLTGGGALVAAWLVYIHAVWFATLTTSRCSPCPCDGGGDAGESAARVPPDVLGLQPRPAGLRSGGPRAADRDRWRAALVEEATQQLRDQPAGSAGGAPYGAGVRLAWLSARAALALDPSNETVARLTALLAEASWPYFFAWPESCAALGAALGGERAAGYADRVRSRHAARWPAWDRPATPLPPLPPPSALLAPFRTAVLIWDLQPARIGNLRALAAAACALYREAEVGLGLCPIVTSQYSSTTLYHISYHIQ
jgi:hypothetical protein